MALTKEQILAARPVPTKTISVPEWGGEVLIRPLTAAEKGRIDDRYPEGKQFEMRAHIVVLGVCDEDGKPLFTMDNIKRLNEQAIGAIERVAAEIMKFSYFTLEDVDAFEKK